MMRFCCAVGMLLCLTAHDPPAHARDLIIENVDSVVAAGIDLIKPSTILFSDRAGSGAASAGPDPELMTFDQWARTRPDEKQLLGLYPGYPEPTIGKTTNGRHQSLTMYIATARIMLDRAFATPDLDRYVTLSFVEHIDPGITQKPIAPSEVAPLINPKAAHNRNPAGPWCVARIVVCVRSHYKFEGKLPLGIHLVNKLRDASKRIADYLEFESEFVARTPDELDQPALMRLTHLDIPIVGALEQTTFYVNEVLQFAKSILVFQRDPAANKTVVTAFIAIAVDSKLLDAKKEYAKVPVLRNLVPVQVLMGRSSFNSGTSISAGLPNYARSRIKAIAQILDRAE